MLTDDQLEILGDYEGDYPDIHILTLRELIRGYRRALELEEAWANSQREIGFLQAQVLHARECANPVLTAAYDYAQALTVQGKLALAGTLEIECEALESALDGAGE